MVMVLDDYDGSSCWGLHLGLRFFQTRGFWRAYELLLVFLFKLWLNYCALIFYLFKTVVEVHVTMDMKHSMTFSLEVKLDLYVINDLLDS
jgi:hypothetical protein